MTAAAEKILEDAEKLLIADLHIVATKILDLEQRKERGGESENESPKCQVDSMPTKPKKIEILDEDLEKSRAAFRHFEGVTTNARSLESDWRDGKIVKLLVEYFDFNAKKFEWLIQESV